MAENQNAEPLQALLHLAEQILGRALTEDERKLLYGWAETGFDGADGGEDVPAYQQALKQTQETIRQGQAQTAAAINATLESIRQARSGAGPSGAHAPGVNTPGAASGSNFSGTDFSGMDFSGQGPAGAAWSGGAAPGQAGESAGQGPDDVRRAADLIAHELEIIIARQVAAAITESVKPLEDYLEQLSKIIAGKDGDKS